MKKTRLAAGLVLPLGGVACVEDDAGTLPTPDAGVGCPEGEVCTLVEPGEDAEDDLLEALIDAEEGETIVLAEGEFEIRRGLSLSVDGVTIRGQGEAESVLSFAEQETGSEGLLVTADDFAAEDFGVENPPGDGVTTNGSSGVTLRRVRVEWTGEPGEENGAYGLYAVQSENVLIEDSFVRGASDAGFYVGQSERVIVRRNRAEENVAGIEIENSFDVDVYENRAEHNTGGVLVFNLPGLPVQNGERIRVFDNEIVANNTPNFAPAGNIVARVPQGTGVAMIAAREVEIFENEIRDNQTVNAGIVSYHITQLDYDDDAYTPYSSGIYLYDNEFAGGGHDPTDDLGALLAAAMSDVMDEVEIPDVVWDGYLDPERSEEGELVEPHRICIAEGDDVDFGNIDFENGMDAPSLDRSPHDCERETLPEVTLP